MISHRQREVYDFLSGYLREHGKSPTFSEIGLALGMRSASTVSQHIESLERAGYIRKMRHVSRGIELTATGPAPLVTTVQAETAERSALCRIADSLEVIAGHLSSVSAAR